jgi:hypothetical protein
VRADEMIAVLPWHLYQPLPFADGRLTANPAEAFFSGHLLVPSDPELPGDHRVSPSPGDIGSIDLQPHSDDCRLADALRRAHIHWVVMESTPGSTTDIEVLQRCGYRIAEGENLEVTVLHD